MEHPPHYHEGETPGALSLGQAKATQVYCGFYIFYYFSPIFVAPLADGPRGKFPTLVTSLVLYILGIVALIITSIPINLSKGWGVPGLAVTMVLVGLGGGGTKAILSSFIADQYKKPGTSPVKLGNGEQVVIDYHLTLDYIYNLYYWVGNIGSLSWFATVFIERHHGFAAAYSLPLGFLIAALLILLLAFSKDDYTKQPSEETLTVSKAVKIMTYAARNGFKMDRANPDCHEEEVAWKPRNVTELTSGLRACRVLLSFATFYVCFDQMQNNLISQAGTMKTHGTPNDVLPAFNQVGCIIATPVIQHGINPLLHRRRIYPGSIMRIVIGFSLVALSMVYATGLQHAIYSTQPCSWDPSRCSKLALGSNGLDVWLQLPIYLLISTGEVFCLTTAFDFAYAHSPEDMRVIVQAINLLIAGIGSVMALSLSSVANDPNLVAFYASLAAAMAATTITFYLVFRSYDRDDRLSSTTESLGQNK